MTICTFVTASMFQNTFDFIIDICVGILPIMAIMLAIVGIGYKMLSETNYPKYLLYKFYKSLPSGRFKFYYTNDKSIKADAQAKKMAEICHHGYADNSYDDIYERLSEFNFPIMILINWARSIVDDLSISSFPVNQVIVWNDYLNNSGKSLRHSFHPSFIDFKDHELAYLWGAVYYWLKCLLGNKNTKVFALIEEIGMHKKYAQPYFLYFKQLADNDSQLIDEDETELKARLKEALTLPDSVTAKQKVRMELACRLMEKSGVTKTVLEHHGNKDKAGTIMGTLLDISPLICKQYISQRDLNTNHHKETIKTINPLLKELGTDIQL